MRIAIIILLHKKSYSQKDLLITVKNLPYKVLFLEKVSLYSTIYLQVEKIIEFKFMLL